MNVSLQIFSFKKLINLILLILICCFCTAPLLAQSNESAKPRPLHAGATIWDLTGHLRWYNYYTKSINLGLEENSTTEIKVELRHLKLISPQFALGFKTLATVYVSGFFKGAGLGGVAVGPVTRFYLLRSKHFYPYLQGNLLAGLNLPISDGLNINNQGSLLFRSALQGGLDYRVSNAFSIFFEIGPTWEYDKSLQLDSHALKINLGIELFRF